ncbi:hypothetical protein [uncultured Methylophaga sp.]|uniref:hypothetical protein n=1 Tax=uncultured Methylophaga sp. TaxID=285271 RepID=UPI002619E3C3|nr:hypothetical protein [uncultured Methylophaga sp.]
MEQLVLVIGLISGAATIISFLMEKAGVRGNWVHAAYGFFIALFASVLVANFASFSAEQEVLKKQITQLTSIQYQAAKILKYTPRNNDGERRGFMFAGLSFLESHKAELPDTYDMARQFSISSGILENKQEDGSERLYQGWALIDGANAMESLLKGVAAGVQEDEI